MAERSSPDNSLLAHVIAAKAQGTYTLQVRDVRRGDILAKQTIATPVGYHAHIVSLTWSEDSRIVTATIDHDFGDDNIVFDLRIERTDA
jgi:protease II